MNDAVARAYTDGRLRMSLVRNALFDRANTGDNTPAFCELKLVPGAGAVLHVLLKGGGSDNASRVVMLPPGAGAPACEAWYSTVCARRRPTPARRSSSGWAWAHLRQGGGARQARPSARGGKPRRKRRGGGLEEELLAEVNALGIGPAALGGAPTALAVHLETAPCHIAALPVAVNMGCCAMRSASIKFI